MSEEEKNNDKSLPDFERRRLLKKLAVAGIAVPTAILLVDGSKNVSFAS
ncbi:twin-arginine translocation signal domain-containing protein [candidate division CSSED10-310 bacterium]|uniref:Twin-arginine translocation signal domain-containing protein n=1 Tax=candidate division CSSED10-310 bacterium TaxID=2855610 RepID=A0ABV6Z0J8_UNCC1